MAVYSTEHKKLLCSTSGSTLLELSLTIGILSISILSITWTLINISKKQVDQNFIFSLIQNRLLFQGVIASDNAWTATVSNNPSMNCLQTHSSCTATANLGPQTFKLYDQNSNLYYDGINALSGFTASGSTCNSFSNSADCVLHLDLSWKPQCDAASSLDPNCLSPYVQILGSYSYLGPSTVSFNWAHYNFQYGRATPRLPSSALPCLDAPPAGGCNAPKIWVCMPPPSYWECHLLTP